jgi:hypothetical protein
MLGEEAFSLYINCFCVKMCCDWTVTHKCVARCCFLYLLLLFTKFLKTFLKLLSVKKFRNFYFFFHVFRTRRTLLCIMDHGLGGG